MDTTKTLESVQEYYGKVLKDSKDLKTSACCTLDAVPVHLREIVGMIHEEVSSKFYGCGTPIPAQLEGKTVLDLGSGTGRDCYILSKLVGPKGKVIGVDMTDEQLEVANRHVDYHTKKFGYSTPNVSFHKGYIEDLEGAGIASNSVDVVVSNCVVNLSPDKPRVFSEIFRVLKPGGELYYSDVFSDRRVPKPMQTDPVLLGECLGGALYKEDFRRIMEELGCKDVRVLTQTPITLTHSEVADKVGMINFSSITIRAFKLDLEDRCEDFGQVAIYKGTIPESPHAFQLDDHHLFFKGRPMPVCGNTALMLSGTRFAEHFEVIGDTNTHYGLFDCGPDTMATTKTSGPGACC